MDFAGDGLDTSAVSIDDQVGDLPIERIAGRHQFFEDFFGIAVFQYRPVASALRALQLLFDAGIKVNDVTARAEMVAGFRICYGAAAGSKDHAVFL